MAKHRNPRRIKTIAEKFWRHVDKTDDGCWLWTGYRRNGGYGQFTVTQGKSPKLAHRVAWELTNGPLPDDACCCHRCDNPPCVNPAHIFLGTRRDNLADMRSKGRDRSLVGEAHVNAKLTEAAVREIRQRCASGEKRGPIARDFGVSAGLVTNIYYRRGWAHVV